MIRLILLALTSVLVLGSLGSLALARDAFDSEFDDCPKAVRLSAVSGLTVQRTEEEDEIRISWDALDQNDLNQLGSNFLKARLSVIVENGGDEGARHVALGDNALVVDGVEFARDLTVSLAVTLGEHVISDIAETEFTSGMPAPSFMTDILANVADADDADGDGDISELIPDGEDYGDFYYLGFNHLFDNWYISDAAPPRVRADIGTWPTSAKFRIGLQHGNGNIEPGDADFENYRITIEDSNEDVLGYQAETIESWLTYSKVRFGTRRGRVIYFGETSPNILQRDREGVTVDGSIVPMSNVRLSNQVADGPRAPYFAEPRFSEAAPDGPGQAFGQTRDAYVGGGSNVPAAAAGWLYARAPAEHFDFPKDVFDGDGNYVIKAWAEDDEGTRISPQTSVTLGVQRGTDILNSDFTGRPRSISRQLQQAYREWDSDAEGLTLALYGLSIHDN